MSIVLFLPWGLREILEHFRERRVKRLLVLLRLAADGSTGGSAPDKFPGICIADVYDELSYWDFVYGRGPAAQSPAAEGAATHRVNSDLCVGCGVICNKDVRIALGLLEALHRQLRFDARHDSLVNQWVFRWYAFNPGEGLVLREVGSPVEIHTHLLGQRAAGDEK